MEVYKIIKEDLSRPLEGIKGVQVFFAPIYLPEDDLLMHIFRQNCLVWLLESDASKIIRGYIYSLGVEETKDFWFDRFWVSQKEKISDLRILCGDELTDRLIDEMYDYIGDTINQYAVQLN